MNKKYLVVFILVSCVTFGTFAQQTEKLTFVDRRSDGTIIGPVTVNAIFISWNMQKVSIENNLQVIRESVYNNNTWSDWQIVGREPARVSSIRQLYDIILGEYNRYPRSATRLNMQNGIQAVRLMSIPTGRSSPMWWNDDGRSFNVMYEFWAIIP